MWTFDLTKDTSVRQQHKQQEYHGCTKCQLLVMTAAKEACAAGKDSKQKLPSTSAYPLLYAGVVAYTAVTYSCTQHFTFFSMVGAQRDWSAWCVCRFCLLE